jgi:hypothetical protein
MAKRPDFSQKPRKSISNRDLTSPGEVMSDRLLGGEGAQSRFRIGFGGLFLVLSIAWPRPAKVL